MPFCNQNSIFWGQKIFDPQIKKSEKSKNLIFPKKNPRSKKAKTRFFIQFISIWSFLHQKIAMNHKISPKKLISDLKTAKNAKTGL